MYVSSACPIQLGLTAVRRMQGRKKFEKAVKRRKGQVAPVRQSTGSYGGEGTGIKAGVSKSRRFG